jgi:hypothetical protein
MKNCTVTNERIRAMILATSGRRSRTLGGCPAPPAKVCKIRGCTTVLSRYNVDAICAPCQRKESE